ncbi:MAG: pyruvate dehydrogenase complex dihydrolipoamide acetyltransferase [Ktedonobacteraceae bacterium]|nr:pyruvate dehydrogenase complex dihydrolipoamide acetyltransferase [Ktedonobacteraceae bacterium]
MPEINMPRLSDTMQEGTITRWLKKPGDEVKKGEVVAEVETDKANMEIESFNAGVLEQILVKEGETAPIGQPIAVVGSGASMGSSQSQPAASAASHTESASTEQARASSNNSTASTSQSAQVAASSSATNGQVGRENGFIKISPLARRMAEEHGIELSQINGTGPGGRIVRDDIEDYIEQRRTSSTTTPVAENATATTPVSEVAIASPSQPSATSESSNGAPEVSTADSEIITLSSMQRTIARRLTESKQTIPHFYVGAEIDMTDVLAMRQKLNANLDEDGVKISVNDLIIKACALALEKFPQVNASYKEGQFVLHKQINIGIAVDIPAGLVVPVIRDANTKGLRTIAREARALIAKAQSGKLSPSDFDGGTFSISNLGMMDVTEFSAVINPPHAAILAVASTRKTFVPINDQPVIRDIMHVTLSADHRVIYGAMVARFLQEVKRILQNVYPLLG